MIRVNPILKKDLKITSRSVKLCLELLAYEGILALIFLIAISTMSSAYINYGEYGNRYSDFVSLFPTLSIAQIVMVGLIVPIMTASSISGERERQTFDIMLTTSMTPFAIILGKVTSAVARVMLFVIASVPIMSLSFILGGMEWISLLYFLVAICIYAFFAGSIGILCSALCRKSLSSIILAYAENVAVYGLTFLPCLLKALTYQYSAYSSNSSFSLGITPLFLLLNPVVFFEEFYVWLITGSFEDSLMNSEFQDFTGGAVSWLMTGSRWMIASGIMILLLTLGFMLLAARRINPLKGKSFEPKRKAD
jgi:ABC-type transport system involved in multi-copper enzyme maturation permease subunit